MPEGGLSYRDTGVDIDQANRAMAGIAGLVRSTRTPDTLSGHGSFGGVYRVPAHLSRPVLVASTDGVGTKLKLAFMMARHDTVGEDLVNHCVNDILVQGATPLFFLDYIGVGVLEPATIRSLVEGMARGCRANGCALLGGETAEMPGFYATGEYDLAGTIVGVVEEDGLIDGSRIEVGDAVIALASSGLHTNGYSLARHVVFESLALNALDPFPGDAATVADVLMTVHRSYLAAIRPLLGGNVVRGLAHITGGGLLENVPRVLPPGTAARLHRASWEVPNVFRVLQSGGNVSEEQMFRTFNMGIGMVAIVRSADADSVVRDLREAGEDAWTVGEIVPGDREVKLD